MEDNLGQIEFKLLRSHIKGFVIVFSILTSIIIYLVSIASNLVILEKVLFCLIPSLGFGIYLINLIKYKVVVNNKTISVKSLFYNKTTQLGLLENYSYQNQEIVIKTTYDNNLKISFYLEQKELFIEWLSHYSQNPEHEKEVQLYNALKEELENNPAFGKTNAEKAVNWKKAKIVTYVLHGVAIFNFLLNFFAVFLTKDNSYPLLLSILFPFLCLYALHHFKGLIIVGFNPEKLMVQPNLIIPFVLSIFSVCFSWLHSGYLINASQLLWYDFFLAIVLTSLFLIVTKEVNFKKITDVLLAVFILMFSSLIYSHGTLLFLNQYKVNSELKIFRVEVLEKRVTNQKDSVYHLTLSPWYKNKTSEEIKVRKWLYDSVEKKDSIHIFLSQGNLGIEWYWLEE